MTDKHQHHHQHQRQQDRRLSLLTAVLVWTCGWIPALDAAWITTTTAHAQDHSTTTLALATTSSSYTEDEHWQETCRQLCRERNLPLEKVKNARDLATSFPSVIRPGRIFRTGRVSDATDQDVQLLLQQINTLVDLRSPTELKDDPTLLRPAVFENFTTIVWKERGRHRDGCLRELPKGVEPFQRRNKNFWKRKQTTTTAESLEPILEEEDEDELCTLDCAEDFNNNNVTTARRRERHFVSLMNEFKYVKGTLGKLRKRDITRAMLHTPGALLSKRARDRVQQPFLDEINDGGLPLLNELLLRFGAPGIKYVLQLCADRERHPIAFYCTAGKDRTGILAALILSICNVPDEYIIQDYMLSANVYAEMNDHQAMVGALSQRKLDPKTFLSAPPRVMYEILQAIRSEYGSVEGYCDWIGFGPEQREKLKRALTED